jgi:hypothetical protein
VVNLKCTQINPTFINGKIVEKDGEITSEPYDELSKLEIEPERFDELDKKADEFFLAYKIQKEKEATASDADK